MSAPAFEAAVRRVSASSSGRGLGAVRRVGSAHRVARVSHRQHASFRTARAERVRRRGAAAAPCAEKYAVSTEDAKAMFDARFPPGSVPVAVRETACGRGLVALRPIDEGDLLLSVPWRHTVHVFEGGHDDPDDLRLALELLRVLDGGGADAPEDERVAVWRAYRPMLPSSTGAAAFWTERNVDELQHADAVEETRALRLQFEASATRRADATHTKEDILWALSMVHSRSFSVTTPEGTARALVPFADLFNHKPESPAQARNTDAVLQAALAAERCADDEKTNDDANAPPRANAHARSGEPWSVTHDDALGFDASARFEMRSIWRYAEGEEVFITYGHETSAELLASYGFFPAPNAGDFVRLYADMQDILDDDRYLSRDANRDAALAMEREAVMWSALAVDAPLAVRPGGVAAAAHLLGCLRLMHAHGATLGALRDQDVPHIGHSTFVWHGDAPCGLWAEACRDVAMDDASPTPSAAGAVERGDEDLRVAVDRAALGQAAARCVEMLAEFPTSLEEDEATLRELANTSEDEDEDESDESDESDLESAEQFAVAVAYRVSVKRLLGAFLEECLAMGVPPSEW
jgi:hypothetical protein